MRNLPTSWQESTGLTLQAEFSLSIYIDAKADTKDIIAAQVRIKKAFPALAAGFYDTLDDRIRANGFTIQRLKDAVDYVIDNCHYPQPSIADFVGYDKLIECRNWRDMTREEQWDTFLPVKLPDRPKVVWIHANDIAQYKLEKYQVK